ncbi:MAG: hypothetical protein KDD82_25480, partial [Planctomycetes bacterium]|nr:hypothetical protein [Planctomycetota bacterium]
PLAQLLGALRSELDGGAGHTARAPALALWIAAGVLLLASVAAAAFAASWTREARSRARDLQELNAELAAAEQALEQVQRDVATAQAQRPDPVSPPTDLGQLRQVDAWVELHAATLEPRLVGRELLLGWVRLLPESPASMELQGRYAFYLGRIPQAVELYARASRADALSPPAAALYALCLSMLGRNEEAQRELVELSKREPCPEALWAQGLLQPAQRQQLLREAAEQAPLSPAIQHTVVPGPRPAPPRERQALLERWDQLVRAHPAWESAVYRRSYAAYSDWLQSQRVSEALVLAYMRDLKIARDLNPNPAYWLYEGKSYVETGRPWLALGPLEATKRLLPSGSAPILAEFMTWELVALGQTGKTQAAVRVLEALERVSAQAADMAVRVLRERDPKAASELDHARAEGGR